MQFSMAEWSAEITIVETQILRWLQSQPANEPLIQAIRNVCVADAMMLGVEDTLWFWMNQNDNEYEINVFEDDLQHSDIWQCAVAGALTRFRAG